LLVGGLRVGGAGYGVQLIFGRGCDTEVRVDDDVGVLVHVHREEARRWDAVVQAAAALESAEDLELPTSSSDAM
jgi:hypothetical protein